MVTLQVVGSTTDWGVGGSPSIEDAVYNHLRQKWSIPVPPVTDFDTENKAWDNMGQHHLFVQRMQTTGNRRTIEATGFFNYVTRLRIHCVMQRLFMGQIPPDLNNMSTEVQRICWMYSPYWIAGIQEFDNIVEVPIDEPDSPANPFKNTYHIVIEVDAFYMKGTDFVIDVAPYNPASYIAGQLTYLPP
jgi:hypothetical protein